MPSVSKKDLPQREGNTHSEPHEPGFLKKGSFFKKGKWGKKKNWPVVRAAPWGGKRPPGIVEEERRFTEGKKDARGISKRSRKKRSQTREYSREKKKKAQKRASSKHQGGGEGNLGLSRMVRGKTSGRKRSLGPGVGGEKWFSQQEQKNLRS